MTLQNFPSKEGNKSSNSDIYSRKRGLMLKIKSFYVQNRSSLPRLTPNVNFSNFQGNFFHFVNFGTSP